MINLDNLKKDYYYYNLYKKFGEDYIIDAGYFETEHESSLSDCELIKSLYLTTTSLPNKDDIKKNSIILLNTGCYNPIHDDHIQMMVEAKNYMEEKNYHVIAGYFAPDLDNYVKTKSEKYLNIFERIDLINNKTTLYDWLNVDPWAGIYLDVDVNFTTIYRRLELYIKQHLGINIQIYYVCGSDRTNFSKTFPDNNIIVNRFGYAIGENVVNKVYPTNYLSESSTNIRKNWVVNKRERKNLSLRVDDINPVSIEVFKTLHKYFKTINFQTLDEQTVQFNDISGEILSLDSLLYKKNKLEISRFYNLSGNKKIKLDNRIGSKSIQNQITKIDKSKQYVLFDDDTFTGDTFNFVKQLLPNNILETKTLLSKSNDNVEILDLRDFYFGDNNGLSIITHSNEKFRVPYIYPFVNVYSRCSINNPIEFSIDIWTILYNHYIETNLTIKDREYFNILKYIGFNPNYEISDVCEYFINQLI